jgi:hypothetical protein
MSFEDNPAEEDPHGECRHEIHALQTKLAALVAAVQGYCGLDGRDGSRAIQAWFSEYHNQDDQMPHPNTCDECGELAVGYDADNGASLCAAHYRAKGK